MKLLSRSRSGRLGQRLWQQSELLLNVKEPNRAEAPVAEAFAQGPPVAAW